MSETPRKDAIMFSLPMYVGNIRLVVDANEFGKLEAELAAMTAAKELAERELHNRTNSYLEHVHDLAIERDVLTAAKEFAERQVTLLAGTLAGPVYDYPFGSMSWSAGQWAEWSREQAVKEGGRHDDL